MGAPVAAASALAKTRTGRKIAIGVLICCALVSGLALSPLWLIPLALAAHSSPSSGSGESGMPIARGAWGYPLSGEYSTGRGFGWHPIRGCAYCPSDHEGIDLASGCGQTVYAVSAGRVINAGAMPGWGNTVRIDHGDRLVTLYGHMQWNSLLVDVGDDVDIGTPLGLEGNTGKSTGCHLHFEIQSHAVAIDPEPFMTALGLPLR